MVAALVAIQRLADIPIQRTYLQRTAADHRRGVATEVSAEHLHIACFDDAVAELERRKAGVKAGLHRIGRVDEIVARGFNTRVGEHFLRQTDPEVPAIGLTPAVASGGDGSPAVPAGEILARHRAELHIPDPA